MEFNAADFLAGLCGGDSATVADRADHGRCSDVTSPETPVLPQAETKSSIDDKASQWHWQRISDEDRQYLLGPSLNDPPAQGELARRLQWVQRRHPEPCPWCGGRLRHNPTCCALGWEPTLPFGKHRGKPVSQVPNDYLRWLLETARDLNDDLRTAVESRLSEDAD